MRTKPTNTTYCENCMCYVPEDVACADAECPIEGHETIGEQDLSPLDFRQEQSLTETNPEDWMEFSDTEELSLLEELRREQSVQDEDPYCGC